MKKAFVTGAAGFIGSNLVERLLAAGVSVVGWDNFSTGQREFLAQAAKHPSFRLIEGDNLEFSKLLEAMGGCDIVFHLAANADVRFGTNHPKKDLEQNTIATFNVLEAMRQNGIREIVFASTGAIYGECVVIPTPEDAPFPVQTSLYGASKLACEGLIQAFAEGFGMRAVICRFVSIVGERYTHGHVFDFCKQLRAHPDHLDVLGNGTQRKSYLYVQDCIDAILHVLSLNQDKKVEIYNLGINEYCQVTDSIRWICEELGVKPKLQFTGGDRGWIGDNPFIFLDVQKLLKTGWSPKKTIREGIVMTLQWLQKNPEILDRR